MEGVVAHMPREMLALVLDEIPFPVRLRFAQVNHHWKEALKQCEWDSVISGLRGKNAKSDRLGWIVGFRLCGEPWPKETSNRPNSASEQLDSTSFVLLKNSELGSNQSGDGEAIERSVDFSTQSFCSPTELSQLAKYLTSKYYPNENARFSWHTFLVHFVLPCEHCNEHRGDALPFIDVQVPFTTLISPKSASSEKRIRKFYDKMATIRRALSMIETEEGCVSEHLHHGRPIIYFSVNRSSNILKGKAKEEMIEFLKAGAPGKKLHVYAGAIGGTSTFYTAFNRHGVMEYTFSSGACYPLVSQFHSFVSEREEGAVEREKFMDWFNEENLAWWQHQKGQARSQVRLFHYVFGNTATSIGSVYSATCTEDGSSTSNFDDF